jgi:PelA/Pel-15E family pectate lyase
MTNDIKPLTLACLCSLLWTVADRPASAQTRQEVQAAIHRSVSFFRQHASAGGGYVFQLSADLSKREGEGKVGSATAWIEPPATPSVGMAYLAAYRSCGDEILLQAARETAGALVRGQLLSGGWDDRIEFDPQERSKYAYRVDLVGTSDAGKRRNSTTFDDDKSQSVIRFLMQLDKELELADAPIHEAATVALEAVIGSQYANGAWPQRFSETPAAATAPSSDAIARASLPETWSRSFPDTKYSGFYTLNDNTMSDLILTLLDAWETYGDQRYRESAERGGEFFLRAQLPEPQPGWAQQYDQQMHPVWARKFEPPAISGSESQGVMRTLMVLYRRTAASSPQADRFLEPLPRAIRYFRRSALPDGQLARFYELGSNRPLFFTKDYQLTYSSNDLPTHYAFVVRSKLDEIETELNRLRATPRDQLGKPSSVKRVKRSESLDARVRQVVDQLDDRGAWVEAGKLRYHGDDDPTREVIRSETFIRNLQLLADWLAATD